MLVVLIAGRLVLQPCLRASLGSCLLRAAGTGIGLGIVSLCLKAGASAEPTRNVVPVRSLVPLLRKVSSMQMLRIRLV